MFGWFKKKKQPVIKFEIIGVDPDRPELRRVLVWKDGKPDNVLWVASSPRSMAYFNEDEDDD